MQFKGKGVETMLEAGSPSLYGMSGHLTMIAKELPPVQSYCLATILVARVVLIRIGSLSIVVRISSL